MRAIKYYTNNFNYGHLLKITIVVIKILFGKCLIWGRVQIYALRATGATGRFSRWMMMMEYIKPVVMSRVIHFTDLNTNYSSVTVFSPLLLTSPLAPYPSHYYRTRLFQSLELSHYKSSAIFKPSNKRNEHFVLELSVTAIFDFRQ